MPQAFYERFKIEEADGCRIAKADRSVDGEPDRSSLRMMNFAKVWDQRSSASKSRPNIFGLFRRFLNNFRFEQIQRHVARHSRIAAKGDKPAGRNWGDPTLR